MSASNKVRDEGRTMLVIMLVVSKQATFCFSWGGFGRSFLLCVCVIVEKRRKFFCRLTRLTGRSTRRILLTILVIISQAV